MQRQTGLSGLRRAVRGSLYILKMPFVYVYPHVWVSVREYKQKASSVYKDYNEQHGELLKDLLRRFSILKWCRNKFDCLVNEMLFIRDLKPTLNVQSHSFRVKVST